MIFKRSKKKKDDDIQSLFLTHVQLVRQALEQLVIVVASFLANRETLRDDSFKLHEIEHEADELRRRIQAALAAGAFLPFYREDYITLADMVDKIANRAVDLAKSLVLERPVLPTELHPDFQLLAHSVLETYMPLATVLDSLFTDPDSVSRFAVQVCEGEQVSDSIEWKLSKRIFADPAIPRAEQIIATRAIARISAISDAIENAADKARVIVAKQAQ